MNLFQKYEMQDNRIDMQYMKRDDRAEMDGDLEMLLQLQQQNENLYDILIEHREWSVLYHLSPLRRNVLEWIDFRSDGTALEIGAECGAVTGLLSERLQRVVAQEASCRKTMINALRNRECGNVRFVVGELQDIQFESRFDYITMIGVKNRDVKEQVHRAGELLAEKGILIIAADNRMRVNAWVRSAADELSEDYERGADGLSRSEWHRLLRQEGFSDVTFYYPVPDYRFASEIYSDDWLPDEQTLCNTQRINEKIQYQFRREDVLMRDICAENLFPLFASSYLVLCKK